jgi:hypothetical protein
VGGQLSVPVDAENRPAIEPETGSTSRRRHSVRRVIQVMFVAHLVVRTVAFGSAYFVQDDFVFQGQAARRGVFTSEYLLHIHSDHLMPAGYLLAGLAEWISPLNYWVVLLTLVPLQALASWLTIRLLLALFGPRWLVLVPIAVALFSPLTLPSSTWWAAALNLLPVQAAGSAAAWAGLCLVRSGQRRFGVASLLAVTVGLTFDNKAALVPLVVLVVMWVAEPSQTGVLRSAWLVVRRWWWLWLGFLLLLGGWLAAYLSLSEPAIRNVSDSPEVVRTAVITFVEGLIPSLAGGPVVWASVPGSGGAYAAPPTWFTVLSMHLLAALVVWGVLNSAPGRRAWIGAGFYVLADLALLALGRSGLVETIGLNLRYTADAILLLVVAIGASLMPPRDGTPGRFDERVRALIAQRPTVAKGVGIVVLYAYLAAAMVSHVGILGHLADNDSRDWLANVRASVEDVGGSVAVLDTGVPDFVYWGLGHPYNQLSWILAPVDGVNVVPVVTELTRFDEQGVLRAAGLDGMVALPGPDGSCGWAVDAQGARVRLAGQLFPWRYVLRIGYYTRDDTSSVVSLEDGDPVEVPFRGGGLREVFVDVNGGGRAVAFEPTTDGGVVCVDVEVGEPEIEMP